MLLIVTKVSSMIFAACEAKNLRAGPLECSHDEAGPRRVANRQKKGVHTDPLGSSLFSSDTAAWARQYAPGGEPGQAGGQAGGETQKN